jgi:hypothetical protein
MNSGVLIHRLRRALLLCVAGVMSACTAITDFDESRLKISLDEILVAENISLVSGSENSVLTLRFSKAFSGKDKVLFEQMPGNSLSIVLADDTSLPDAVVTQKRVLTTPTQTGEFNFVWDATGKIFVVTFFNPPEGQFPLVSGDALTLIIDVAENSLLYDDVYTFNISVD